MGEAVLLAVRWADGDLELDSVESEGVELGAEQAAEGLGSHDSPGVARGALYHHFSGKDALFRSVYDAVQADAVSGVMAAALAVQEPWAAVRAGLSAFLDACLDPAFRRVVVLDSVSVLHQEVWEGGIEDVELPMLRTVLTPLVATNVLPGVAVEPLVHVALGGLYGAALFIARSPEPEAARGEVDAVLDTLIGGLRTRVASPAE